MSGLFRWIAAALLILLLTLGASLVGATWGQDKVPLVHDGYLILRIRVAQGGMTAAERVSEIQIRLQDLMAYQFAYEDEDIPNRLQARRWRGEVIIGTPDCLLVTVTQADARANNSDCLALARLWRDRLARAMVIATRTG